MSEDTDAKFSIPEFDPKSTRRAVWRGLIRTALAAGMALFMLAVLVGMASLAMQRPKNERAEEVLVKAIEAAYPGYSIGLEARNEEFRLGPTLEGGAATRAAVQRDVAHHSLQIRLDVRGRMQDRGLSLPMDPVARALQKSDSGHRDKTGTIQLLERLPAPMRALLVVNLERPMGEEESRQFRFERGICFRGEVDLDYLLGGGPLERDYLRETNRCRGEAALAAVFLEPPINDRARGGACLRTAHGRVSWPRPFMKEYLDWVDALGERDGFNLEKLSLPTSACLKQMGRKAEVFGFVVGEANLELARVLVSDDRVRNLVVADVNFDLGH